MPQYDIEHNMTNHPPKDEHVVRLFEDLRKSFKATAAEIVELCPDSREKSLALTNLEQALMWSTAAVARNQEEI